MERTENDRTVFRPSHKTLKIDETDFHIPTATTTTEQSFHSKPEKPVQTNGAAAGGSRRVNIGYPLGLEQQGKDQGMNNVSSCCHRTCVPIAPLQLSWRSVGS
jgi:hypothetical protein